MLANEADAPKQASKHASLDEVESKHACLDFDSTIAPLEAKAGRRLRGPWRTKWRVHFDESPEGFIRVRDDVLARPWVRSVFAYFMSLLSAGDHLDDRPLPATRERRSRWPAPKPEPAPEPCSGCGTVNGRHGADCEIVAERTAHAQALADRYSSFNGNGSEPPTDPGSRNREEAA